MKIEMMDVSCGYGKNSVLSRVNLTVDMEETTILIGANGIGKTTLFKAILGSSDVISGKIAVNGVDITRYSRKEMAKLIAYVPQVKNSKYDMTVEAVVMMGRASYIGYLESPSFDDYESINRVLQFLELDSCRHLMYNELSGGQQQMVLIARALAQETKYLILDEPASNLDYKNQKKLIDTLKKLKVAGIGSLVSVHNLDMVQSICDRIIFINQRGEVKISFLPEILNDQLLSEVYGTDVKILRDGNEFFACVIM